MTYFWSFINYKNKQLPNKNPILDKNDYFFEKQGYSIKNMIWECIALNYKSPEIRVKKKWNLNEYI